MLVAGVALIALTVPAGSIGSGSQPVATALRELSGLEVHPEDSATGYTRAQFGPAWADTDHNGCDTRNDILRRDLTGIRFEPGSTCVVASGRLADPYTGVTIAFVRGRQTSILVQIDHVVALEDAWVTGADRWSAARRLTYANDPLELLAVDGKQNDVKGDKDASGWLPPNSASDCTYVERQIAVKAKYRLWVTEPEKVAMSRVLASPCTGAPSPVVPPTPPAAATSTVTPGAFCSTAGAVGLSKAGRRYVCKASATETRLRWRRG